MMKGYFRLLSRVLCTVLLLPVSFTSLSAKDFTVHLNGDVGDHAPGDGVCSVGPPYYVCTLRAAIQEANSLPGPDTIFLGSDRYVLAISGPGENYAATGDLDIRDDLVINGVSAAQTVVDGAGLDRVFHIIGDIKVTFEKLTVTGGAALGNNEAGWGGGVFVDRTLFMGLYSARVTNNRAINGGGIAGLLSEEIEIIHSDVSHNEVQGVQEDFPDGQGGGLIFGRGLLEILHSTISHNGCKTRTNESCVGGAYISACGDILGLIMRNSTVSSNKGKGFLVKNCYGAIENSTFYGNTGYGISTEDYYSSPTGTISARNTIFADNGIEDCDLNQGAWDFEYGYNLSSDDTCGLSPIFNDKINTDPELYPLGTYEPIGPVIVQTHHPRWGAPVIDSGGNLSLITDDQEGFPRPSDGNQDSVKYHDMGAVEVLPCVFPYPFDLQVSNQLVDYNLTACNKLSVGNGIDVDFDGGPVRFSARTSVEMGDRFKIHSGTIFRVVMSRTAGSGY